MKINKIFLVSGTGASGSSALFDYLKVFPSICFIERELKPEIRKDIYSKWYRNKYRDLDKYKKLADSALKKEIGIKFEDSFTGDILLNNTLSCLNLRGIELFDNIITLCVFRDPRSTWVAWQTEWKDKNNKRKWSSCEDPVGEFIIYHKKCMERFWREYKSLSNKQRTRVHLISFEDFVLDANYRLDIVSMLGLDISLCPYNPELNLTPKHKSIFKHLTYKNKDYILRIQQELKSYCHPLV